MTPHRQPPSGGQPPARRRRRAAASGHGADTAGLADLTQRRILRALDARQRYTWVQPRVLARAALPGGGAGWCVVSPNCSRSVDPAGGEIPIAWLEPDVSPGAIGRWHLHGFDHAQQAWVCRERSLPLGLALQHLQADTDRRFWP